MARPGFTVALILLLCTGVARGQPAYEHEFTFAPDGNPARVNVAGDFNGFSKDATPMTKGHDGIWRAKMTLAEGTYQYKFVVNGEQWLPDPKADTSLATDDNFGGKNSGVIIGPDVRNAPPPKTSHINREWVLHRPDNPADVDNLGDGRVKLRLRVLAGDVPGVGVQLANEEWVALNKLGTAGGLD